MLTIYDVVHSQQTQNTGSKAKRLIAREKKSGKKSETIVQRIITEESCAQESQEYQEEHLPKNVHIDMEGFRTIVLSSGIKVDFTDDFVELLTLECLKYDVLQQTLKSEPMDKKRQTLLYAIGSALHLDISAAEMQEITQLLLREIYQKARRYAREDDGLCAAPAWLHEAVWRMRLLPAEHLPAPAEATPDPATSSPASRAPSGFQLSARAARALLRRLHQTLSILHDPVLGVIWQDVSEVSMQKFSVVLQAGDSLPQSRLLTGFEWRIVDLVLLYDDDLRHCVVTENSLTQLVQRAALEATCEAALAHRVDERVSRAELARRWSRAYQQYMSKGMRSSPVVLQRRWFELKRLARRRGAGGAGGAGGVACALLSRVAPHATPLAWPDLVRKGMVLTEQDLIEAEIEDLVPTLSPDCAPPNPLLENYGPSIEETPVVVKVEHDCYEQEWTTEEQPACFIKQDPDTLDSKPILKRRKSTLFRFESDDESEPEVSPKQTAAVAVNKGVIKKTSSEKGRIAKKLKVERDEDVSRHHEVHDAGIDPKLLMDARVVVERCDFDAILSKKPRLSPTELDIEQESSVDSGDLWEPDSESEGERDEEGEGEGAAEEARPVTLRDIDEVRRLTQLKLTAQVAPVTPPAHPAPPTPPAYPHEDLTIIDSESDTSVAITDETPRVVVKVTNYCPLGLKSTRLRYGEGQSKRDRKAAKRNHSSNQNSLTSSSKKSRVRKNRQGSPAPETPEADNDLQEWLRQRNVNSRYFGPAPTALAAPARNTSLPTYADLIVRTMQSTQNLHNKTNKPNTSSAFTGYRKIAPTTDLSSTSKGPVYKPRSYISMLVAPSESRQEAPPPVLTASPPPLVANNSTGVSSVTAHQSSEPAQSSPSLKPDLKVIHAAANTTAASQHNPSTHLPSTMLNFVIQPGSTIMTTGENQASTSVPLPTPPPVLKSKRVTMTNTILKFKPIVTKSQAPILSNVPIPGGKDMATNAEKLLSTPAQLPASDSAPALKFETTAVTTVTTTAPSHDTTSAQSSAPMPIILPKPVITSVDCTAINKASTSVELPASVSSLVSRSEECTVNTISTYRNPTPAQSLPVPVLVLSPRDNPVTVIGTDHCYTGMQYPALPATSTIAAAATNAISFNHNASMSGGLVLQTPPLLVKHNLQRTDTEASPIVNMLLTSPQMAKWVMDQLTMGTNKPPVSLPRPDETKTSSCTDVTTVQTNEENSTQQVNVADKDKQNDTSANEQKNILEGPQETHPSTASIIASRSLLKSQTGAQCSILGNNRTMSAVDYVNSLNHKKLKVICKKESVPFWIVGNDYLVLTDNPRFVVKGKSAFYTLAPPEEIALLTFDLDGTESEPWEEPAGGAGGAGGEAGGAVLAPNRMCVEGKLYQKMCRSPLRYAQVLGAVRDAAACRRLAARGQALLLYHARRHVLVALRSMRQLLRVIGDLDSGEDVIEIDVPEKDSGSGS